MIRRWFGEAKDDSKSPAADPDQLALDLLKSDWRCACCGEMHHGIMELGAGWPKTWPGEQVHAPNADLSMNGDFLSRDFCVIDGEEFYVRSIFEIPVRGLAEPWGFGCWTTLSRDNFERYAERFDDDWETDELWFGWLSNDLRGYHEGKEFLAVTVWPQPKRKRPKLFVQDEDHKLARAQREGIGGDDLLELLRAYGHGPTVQ